MILHENITTKVKLRHTKSDCHGHEKNNLETSSLFHKCNSESSAHYTWGHCYQSSKSWDTIMFFIHCLSRHLLIYSFPQHGDQTKTFVSFKGKHSVLFLRPSIFKVQSPLTDTPGNICIKA